MICCHRMSPRGLATILTYAHGPLALCLGAWLASCFSLPSAPCFLFTLYLLSWCGLLFHHLSALCPAPSCSHLPVPHNQIYSYRPFTSNACHSLQLCDPCLCTQHPLPSSSAGGLFQIQLLARGQLTSLLTMVETSAHAEATGLLCIALLSDELTVSSPGRSLLSLHSWAMPVCSNTSEASFSLKNPCFQLFSGC